MLYSIKKILYLCDDSPMKVSFRVIELRSRRMLISLALPYSCVYTSSPIRGRGREKEKGREGEGRGVRRESKLEHSEGFFLIKKVLTGVIVDDQLCSMVSHLLRYKIHCNLHAGVYCKGGSGRGHREGAAGDRQVCNMCSVVNSCSAYCCASS